MNIHQIVLPKQTVKDIRAIAHLSYLNQWEYAGALNFVVNRHNDVLFSKPLYDTSKCNRSVNIDVIKKVWQKTSPITFHTHPTPLVTTTKGNSIVTLPSKADFRAYIQMFPKMQSNLIAETSGVYVIDILESAMNNRLPVPESVNMVMNCFRHGLYDYNMKCTDGLEYFSIPIETWSMYISELNQDLKRMFGISIAYYSYDEPIIISIDRKQYLLRAISKLPEEYEFSEMDFK